MGLNLQAADRVIMYDTDFNPQVSNAAHIVWFADTELDRQS